MNELADPYDVPSPRTVALLLALEMLAMERAPWWAAQWLADGCDGPALRELAGLDGKDPHAVRELVPAALDEMGVELPPSPLAAGAVCFRDLAQMLVSRRADHQWVLKCVEQIILQSPDGFGDIFDLPLGRLYGLDDEWEGGWGRTHAELRAEVEVRCAEQLEAAAPWPGWNA